MSDALVFITAAAVYQIMLNEVADAVWYLFNRHMRKIRKDWP